MIYLLAYIFGGVLLNMTIDIDLADPKREWPRLDAFLTFLLFKILWPAGLILFVIKWYQGKASIS